MKKIASSLLAVTLAAGFAAFTAPKPAAKALFNNNYRYTGSTDDLSERSNPLNYVYTESTNICDEGNDLICIINAPGPSGTGEHPSFSNGTDPYSNSAGVTVMDKKAQ